MPPPETNHAVNGQAHPYTIKLADFSNPEVIALIRHHEIWAAAPEQNIPGEKSYTFSLSKLQHPDIALWTAWSSSPFTPSYGNDEQSAGPRLLGFAGLKLLPATCKGAEQGRIGEIKSMHTASAARGLGIGVVLLDHLAAEARKQGLVRLYLETGSLEAFTPARRCYQKAGYVVCGAFSDYVEQANSVFMVKDL